MKAWFTQAVIGLAMLTCTSAYADGNLVQKFALVIGNRDYQGRQDLLANTLRDADLMAQSLKKLGFTVTQRTNLDRSQMLSAISGFADQLPEGSTALVYYAGHGMQVGGNNYLVPVDMALTSEQTVPVKAYPLKTLLERLSASKSAVNLVVLDACRDNPFQPRTAVRYRSFANLGLAQVQAPRGTLIAFSTAPGQLAADGKESHSVYTAALAKTILEPRLEIREIFEKVASQVRKQTLDDQIPWYETSITDKYYFLPPEGVSIVAGKSLQVDAGRSQTQPRRGMEVVQSKDWFSDLNKAEWNRVDWEIRQRVQRMTMDELPQLEHKAQGGNLLAQTTLGLVYKDGVGKASDSTGKVMRYGANNTKALQWLRKAANSGFPVAQVELGEMYYAGHGVDRSLAESRRWLEKAASTDYARAKVDLFQLKLETDTQSTDVQGLLRDVAKAMQGTSPSSRGMP